MNKPGKYAKIVEWSDEDDCFVGTCPGLFYGGAHGSDEIKVYRELSQMVNEFRALEQKREKRVSRRAKR